MNDNIVCIGSKPVMDYCTAIQQVLASSDSVRLKTRGKAISHAVSAAEVTRNRFITDLKGKSINIGIEELKPETGRSRNVSSITIRLKKEVK